MCWQSYLQACRPFYCTPLHDSIDCSVQALNVLLTLGQVLVRNRAQNDAKPDRRMRPGPRRIAGQQVGW